MSSALGRCWVTPSTWIMTGFSRRGFPRHGNGGRSIGNLSDDFHRRDDSDWKPMDFVEGWKAPVDPFDQPVTAISWKFFKFLTSFRFGVFLPVSWSTEFSDTPRSCSVCHRHIITGWWWLEPWIKTWLSRNSWEWKIIPTGRFVHHFSEGLVNHQPSI